MKEKKVVQYSFNGRTVIIINNGRCFMECIARELPNEIKDRIKKIINDAEILKKILL